MSGFDISKSISPDCKVITELNSDKQPSDVHGEEVGTSDTTIPIIEMDIKQNN